MNVFFKFILYIIRILADIEFIIFQKSINPVFGCLWLKYFQVEFDKPISLGYQLYIRNTKNLKVGKFCSIGSFTKIYNYSEIQIGDYTIAAGELTLNTATHDVLNLKNNSARIDIGKRVWIGQRVSILSGVSIGDDVVIGAGSVVITDLPSNTICGGVPAKVMSTLERSTKNIKDIEKERRGNLNFDK